MKSLLAHSVRARAEWCVGWIYSELFLAKSGEIKRIGRNDHRGVNSRVHQNLYNPRGLVAKSTVILIKNLVVCSLAENHRSPVCLVSGMSISQTHRELPAHPPYSSQYSRKITVLLLFFFLSCQFPGVPSVLPLFIFIPLKISYGSARRVITRRFRPTRLMP